MAATLQLLEHYYKGDVALKKSLELLAVLCLLPSCFVELYPVLLHEREALPKIGFWRVEGRHRNLKRAHGSNQS